MLDPHSLRPHYSAFLREGRILLTGHSHQAWPDVARQGQLEAWDAAARDVDDKWGEAFGVADEVRTAIARSLSAKPEEIALGASTHELVTRFLSALPYRERPHVLTTTGEFHSAHRQLERLAEEGIDVEWIDALPASTLAARLADAVRQDTAAVLVSSVLFETSSVLPRLAALADRVHEVGAQLLVDAYHAFMALPLTLEALGVSEHADSVFVTGGGYKYAQWGEGNCFLRVPTGTQLRPVYTGWFSDFGSLSHPRGHRVGYGPRPADVFAGSTYDPTSHYRARSVIRFFEEQGLTVERLRASSLRQTERILGHLEGRDVRTPREAHARGGFVTVHVPGAQRVVDRLREHGVFVDARGDLLRFGPAPYLTDAEIDRALEVFRSVT